MPVIPFILRAVIEMILSLDAFLLSPPAMGFSIQKRQRDSPVLTNSRLWLLVIWEEWEDNKIWKEIYFSIKSTFLVSHSKIAQRLNMSMGRTYFSTDDTVFHKICESATDGLNMWSSMILLTPSLSPWLREKAMFIRLFSRCSQKGCQVRNRK